jgi:hypothetical protein
VTEPKSFTFTKDSLQEALISYAALKLGVSYPLRHEFELHASIAALDDRICTVTLTHLDNVVPIGVRQ